MSSRSTSSKGAVRLSAYHRPQHLRHIKKLSLGLLAITGGILITTQSNGTTDNSKPALPVASTVAEPNFFFNDKTNALQDQQQLLPEPMEVAANPAAVTVEAVSVAPNAAPTAPDVVSATTELAPTAPDVVSATTELAPTAIDVVPATSQVVPTAPAVVATAPEATTPAPDEAEVLLAMNIPTEAHTALSAATIESDYEAQIPDSEAATMLPDDASVGFVGTQETQDNTPKTTTISPRTDHPAIAAIRKKAELPQGATSESVTVAAGDTLSNLLNDRGVRIEHMPQLLTDDMVKQHLSNLDIGQTFQIARLENGDFHSLSARVGNKREVTIRRSENGFVTAAIDLPVEKERVVTSGTIEQSLFVAADLANLKQSTIMELSDIFQWELDFARDIRKGDHFSLIYDRLYREGKYIGDGDILAAEFVRGGKHYQAIRYTDSDGNTNYYSPDGKSKRRTFLRHPVDVVRITSKFDPKRIHPVLHKIRAHKGVDYGSPTGTPIRATSDGVVKFAGSRSAFGNTVILNHGTDITTLYAHMSRISDKVGKGKRVKQGDVIGYVGATGRVTGAHLHYEFQINGNHVDPLKVELPAAKPLSADLLDELSDLSDDLLAQMQSVIPETNEQVVVAVPVATSVASRRQVASQ